MLMDDHTAHVGHRGDGRCGGERGREQVKGEKTDGCQAERYLPRKLGGDLHQIVERGFSGSSHVLFRLEGAWEGVCDNVMR